MNIERSTSFPPRGLCVQRSLNILDVGKAPSPDFPLIQMHISGSSPRQWTSINSNLTTVQEGKLRQITADSSIIEWWKALFHPLFESSLIRADCSSDTTVYSRVGSRNPPHPGFSVFLFSIPGIGKRSRAASVTNAAIFLSLISGPPTVGGH